MHCERLQVDLLAVLPNVKRDHFSVFPDEACLIKRLKLIARPIFVPVIQRGQGRNRRLGLVCALRGERHQRRQQHASDHHDRQQHRRGSSCVL